MSRSIRVAATAVCIANLAACDLYRRQDADPDARSVDAAPVVDAAPDAGVPDAWVPQPRLCTDGETTAAISGRTPLGTVSYSNSWPGYFGGKCNELRVYLTASDPVDANELNGWPIGVDSLFFWLGEPWPEGFVGRHEDVSFQLTSGGESVNVSGTVIIDRFDEPYFSENEIGEVRGSLVIHDEANGWALRGSFGSSYCVHLMAACP